MALCFVRGTRSWLPSIKAARLVCAPYVALPMAARKFKRLAGDTEGRCSITPDLVKPYITIWCWNLPKGGAGGRRAGDFRTLLWSCPYTTDTICGGIALFFKVGVHEFAYTATINNNSQRILGRDE